MNETNWKGVLLYGLCGSIFISFVAIFLIGSHDLGPYTPAISIAGAAVGLFIGHMRYQRIKEEREVPRTGRTILKHGLLFGLALSLMGAMFMGGELVQRIRFAASGGAGESADWGEPLFYILFFGILGGVIGLIAGAALDAFQQRRTQR